MSSGVRASHDIASCQSSWGRTTVATGRPGCSTHIAHAPRATAAQTNRAATAAARRLDTGPAARVHRASAEGPAGVDRAHEIEHPEHAADLELHRQRHAGGHERQREREDREERRQPEEGGAFPGMRQVPRSAQREHASDDGNVEQRSGPHVGRPARGEQVVLGCEDAEPGRVHADHLRVQRAPSDGPCRGARPPRRRRP